MIKFYHTNSKGRPIITYTQNTKYYFKNKTQKYKYFQPGSNGYYCPATYWAVIYITARLCNVKYRAVWIIILYQIRILPNDNI